MTEREYAAHVLEYTNNARLDRNCLIKQGRQALQARTDHYDRGRATPLDEMTAAIERGYILR